jgi:hypothetical protein
MGNVTSRESKTEDTKSLKLKLESWSVIVLRKYRLGTERYRWFHLFERMVVATDCLVWRKDRM